MVFGILNPCEFNFLLSSSTDSAVGTRKVGTGRIRIDVPAKFNLQLHSDEALAATWNFVVKRINFNLQRFGFVRWNKTASGNNGWIETVGIQCASVV